MFEAILEEFLDSSPESKRARIAAQKAKRAEILSKIKLKQIEINDLKKQMRENS